MKLNKELRSAQLEQLTWASRLGASSGKVGFGREGKSYKACRRLLHVRLVACYSVGLGAGKGCGRTRFTRTHKTQETNIKLLAFCGLALLLVLPPTLATSRNTAHLFSLGCSECSVVEGL